ncbi:RNA polymerase sigma factor [Dokdonella koreensis]|uniref:RNA polymerase sigma factor RpoE n=1 Tax=Dokdonella koreensis DS-123 TaxID=1300342 RepID=A0A160DTJ4_9GAMM|nr:RNA polymerase sigma factor [Dokdonella koreensis]ANB17524.1 RNA polymerase sigma factor RpoE [Dokdonella koreensis DS-123]
MTDSARPIVPRTTADAEADLALVQAVLAGAPGAFERLLRQYQGLCWHIVDRMVRHPEDTRELCQEAFLRVHRYLHQYRSESPLKAWIGQVAYSVAKRHLERRRIPLAEAPDGGDGMALAESVGQDFDLEAAWAEDEALGHLHAAIETLPPLQRTLLTLYHLDEVPIGEIAAMTGLAEGTIKSHLFRSRRQLRAVLEPRIGVVA